MDPGSAHCYVMETPVNRAKLEVGEAKGPEGQGGGHCLFEGRYPLPNYRPWFLVHVMCVFSPQFSLTASYF